MENEITAIFRKHGFGFKNVKLTLNEIEKIYKLLTENIIYDPHTTNEYMCLGRYYHEIKRDFDKAKLNYKMAAKLGDYYGYRNIASMCCDMPVKTIDMEIKYLKKEISTRGKITKYIALELARRYHRLEGYGEAIKYYLISIKSDKYKQEAITNLGKCYRLIGYHQTAIKYYLMALKLGKDKLRFLKISCNAIGDYNTLFVAYCMYGTDKHSEILEIANKLFDGTNPIKSDAIKMMYDKYVISDELAVLMSYLKIE